MELLKTDDGSLTVRHSVLGELYHSDRGAIGEAEHVYIRAGLEYAMTQSTDRQIAVFEVGFGTGLNCWLTFRRVLEAGVLVDYRAIELYPLAGEVIDNLNYTDDPTFGRLHKAAWDVQSDGGISADFLLTKYRADLTEFDFSSLAERFHVVYFDAFAPDVQPELWTEEIMAKMYAILKPGGILVTYSSKGLIKEALRAAGFEVMRLPGALGKRHMVRAVKPIN